MCTYFVLSNSWCSFHDYSFAENLFIFYITVGGTTARIWQFYFCTGSLDIFKENARVILSKKQ